MTTEGAELEKLAMEKEPKEPEATGPEMSFDDEAGEQARAQAFAFVPVWRGKELASWGSGMEYRFQTMRQVLGLGGTGVQMGDALRILWMLSVPREAVLVAQGSAVALEEAVEKWVQENVAMDELQAATKLGLDIYNKVDEVTPEAVSDSGRPGEQ